MVTASGAGGYLLDKSASARWGIPAVGAVLDRLVSSRLLYTCPVVELEILYSMRSPREYVATRKDRVTTYRWADTTSEAGRLAAKWQAELATTSHHRAAGLADLLIAATAKVSGLSVLHYDRDYRLLDEKIQGGVPHQFVVPEGSLEAA